MTAAWWADERARVRRCSEDGTARDVQDADGIFARHLPAPLLADVNIVDTPGTNVILDRQQRLTEEFVPRADLVLFTMSAGAPAPNPKPTPCTHRPTHRFWCWWRRSAAHDGAWGRACPPRPALSSALRPPQPPTPHDAAVRTYEL
jgi:hypothetical protein